MAEFIVEAVLGARVVENTSTPPVGKKRKREKITWEYLVKWAGYPDEENTWEPQRNLGSGCRSLLQRFWDACGSDDERYSVGWECYAPADWVAKEKLRFKISEQREKKQEEKKKGKKKLPEAIEAEEPIAEPESVKPAKKKFKEYKESMASVSTSKTVERPHESLFTSDSEDSEPLSKMRPKAKNTKDKECSKSKDAPSLDDTPPLPTKSKKKPPARNSPSLAVTSGPAHLGLFSDDEDGEGQPSASTASAPPPRSSPPPPLPKPARTNAQSRPVQRPPPAYASSNSAWPASGAASGISTKKRLGEIALQYTAPKKAAGTAHTRPTAPERVTTGSTTIMSTGFRSTIQNQPSTRHREPEQTLASLNSRESPPPQSAGAADFSDMPPPGASSPTDHTSKEDPFLINPDPEVGNEMQIEPPPPPRAVVTLKDAETWLGDHLHSLGSTAAAAPRQSTELGAITPALPPLPSRPKKKWSWEGSLWAGFGGQEHPSHVTFKVLMKEEIVIKPTGFSFSIALGTEKELRLEQLYDLVDLDIVLQACKPPAYLCEMVLQKADGNSMSWSTLLNYMSRRQQVGLVPFYLDGNLVGHLLLHPSTMNPLNHKSLTSGGDSLIAWVLLWTLTPEQLANGPSPANDEDPHLKRWFDVVSLEYNKIKKICLETNKERWNKLIKTRPMTQYALRTLGFPVEVYKNLCLSSRAWSIVPPPESLSKGIQDLEGQLLVTILRWIGNPKGAFRWAGAGRSGSVVFIHVGALHNLDSCKYFLDAMGATSAYTRFYTYGTHPKVPSSFWGIQEIYPYGGVVALTPSALLRQPLEVMKKVMALVENPIWAVYVLPSVIGTIAAMLDITDVSKFPFPYILKAISKGEVAMLRAPPDTKLWYGKHDQRHGWLRDCIQGRPLTPQEVLSQGLAAFHSEFSNLHLPKAEWEAKLDEAVTADLKRMQYQPALATNYRRFIVFSGSKIPNDRKGSIEWILPGDFDFKDGFGS